MARSAIPIFERADWMERGACRDLKDKSIMFPDRGQSMKPALAVCAPCPVADECVAYALSLSDDPSGVWGGTSGHQRRAMRRERKAAA